MDNLSVALEMARLGAYVFPCQSEGPNRKQPCRGVYWRSVSTRDEKAIRAFWSRYPDAVPGIDMAKSGLITVDCDRKQSDGLAWVRTHMPVESVPGSTTPSGGRHLIYKNIDPPLGNGRGQLPDKKIADIDVRGAGGFIIAPGAIFADGGQYVPHGSIAEAPEAPNWLVDLLSPPTAPIHFTVQPEPISDIRLSAYGQTALYELERDLQSAPDGDRNNQANLIAFRVGQLVGGGCIGQSEAYSRLANAALAWGIKANDKALGPRGTIARAIRDGMRSPRGPTDDMPAVEIMLGHNPVTEPANEEMPDSLLHPPGLVGAIAGFITATAIYPQPALSLGAALTIVGTAAGRHLAGPTRSGTHLYIVGLAPSGAGKDHPRSMVGTVLSAANLREHLGPAEFISMPAVINFLSRTPLSVCAMDEFGSFLKRINNRKASGFEGAISGMLRSAWGLSFKVMATPEWAGKKMEAICSPAMSIFGVSTPREFYDSLEGADITNGVLNRFLIIESQQRPAEQRPAASPDDVPQPIVDGLKAIYGRHKLGQLLQSRMTPAYDMLAIDEDAEQIRRDMVVGLLAMSDANKSLEPFLARTAENAIRLATIISIGQGSMIIDAGAMIWGRDFAMWSARRLADGAGLYISDSDTQTTANDIKRHLKGKGMVQRSTLLKGLSFKYRARDLDDVLRMMIEAEVISESTNQVAGKFVKPARFYKLIS
jgi:hypothetical protein